MFLAQRLLVGHAQRGAREHGATRTTGQSLSGNGEQDQEERGESRAEKVEV